MKKTNKLLIISIICTTLILSNLPQLTSAEEEPNPNITPLLNQLYTTNLTVTIDTTNPNIINVSGHQSGVSTPLTLTIPESITVRWGATYTSSTTFSGSLINFTGDGTFEVGPGGYLWHMGSGTAINAAGHYVIVSGTNSANSGTIQASTGSAITGSGTNTVITIDGGSVCGDETHNINPVINMNNPENTDKNVIVNNGAIWAMSEDRLAYAIQTYGNIEVNDGEISTRGENGRAINLVGSTSVAYINGGKIWATGISGVAISTATTPGINVDNAGVIITGGVISATSNYAIHVTGAHSFVDVKGGIVNATTGCAIYGERGATVTVSNGFVFAYGTTILGTNNVLHIVGGTPQITSTGVVVAWNNAKYPGPFSVHEQTGLTISPNSATVEWYKKENSKDGISYQNGINANYFPIDGVTVYGLVNVTFNANTNDDDSVLPSMPNKIVTFGSSYGLLATVERHGYNFIGWFTETDTLITESTIVKNTADHTLYAHWSAIDDIVVIFDANAGGDESVVLSEQFMVVTFGEVYGSLVLVDRVGYDFVGWFTDGVGGVEVVDSTLVSNVDSHVLYAHWTAKTGIVVTFDVNAAEDNTVTPSISSTTVTFGDAYGELAMVNQVEPGYIFVGWYTEPEEGSLITSDSLVTNAENHKVYAHWTAKTGIVVTFDVNAAGDYSVILSHPFVLVTFSHQYDDNEYEQLAVVSRTGYIFDGWFTDPNNIDTLIEDTSIVTNNEHHTLYAHWTAKTGIVVTFDVNAAEDDIVEPDPASIKVTFGETYDSLALVDRVGYVFVGWFTEDNGGVLVTSMSLVTNAEDHTLYAHWIPVNGIVVIFDANAGGDESVVLSEQFMVVTFGEVYGSLVLVDRVGYDFVGWFTDGVGGVEVVDSTLVSNVDSHVLYAHWTAKTLNVFFDANVVGNVGVTGPSNSYIPVIFGSAYGDTEDDPLAVVSRYGYEFLGWFTTPEADLKITADTIVTNANPHTLYACWRNVIDIVVTFDSNADDDSSVVLTAQNMLVAYDKPYGLLAKASRSQHEFDGWFTAPIGGSKVTSETDVTTVENHILYAHWTTLNTYHITYDLTDGTNDNNNPTSYTITDLPLTIANPTKTGYEFQHWSILYTDGTNTMLDTNKIPLGTSGDITLTAVWNPVPLQYTISYMLNGGALAAGYPTSYNVENGAMINTDTVGVPVLSGYTFMSWRAVFDSGLMITLSAGGFPAGSVGDVTLVAMWDPTPISYDIIYALAGGVNAPGNPIDYTVAGNFPIVINVPSRDGYVFSHWMVACANGTSLVLPVSGIPDGTTGVITLTAVWVPNTTEEFTVTYNGNEYTNGNIPVDDANPYTAGSTVIVLDANTMIKSNFTFLGWALTSTATTATYQAGDTFDITQDTTLYAVWQENSKYTVTYNGNNNTGGNIPNDSNSPYYTDSTVTLLSNTGNLVRSGYTFLGWATTSSATAPTYTVSGSTISPSTFTIGSTNVVLYAVWKQDATPSPRPSSSGSSSSTQNTPTTSTTPTTDPDKNSTPNTSSDLVIEEDEPTIEWAVLNLVFGVVGFVLAVLFVVVLLLQKIKDDKKGSKDPFDIDGGLWRNNIGWLAVMLILGIAGLVMFILTENTTGNMIWIDSWTLISGTIFISEIIIIPIIFKNK